MLLAVRVNLDHFVQDLMAGDPFVWCIAIGIVGCTAFGIYQEAAHMLGPEHAGKQLGSRR